MAELSEAEAGVLVGIVYDFAIEQRVDRFVEPARVVAWIQHWAGQKLVSRVLEAHVAKALEREQARAAARGDAVRAWLTPAAEQALLALAERPVVLERSFLKKLVEQDAVRHLIRSITSEVIRGFVQSLKSGGGVLGSMGRGAFGMAQSMGKAIFGSVGREVEAQLSRAGDAFVKGSLSMLLERLIEVLSDPAMADELGTMRRDAAAGIMGLSTAELVREAAAQPVAELLGLVPGLLAHNLARPEVQAALLDEATAALALEGARTLRELVEDMAPGALAFFRAEAVRLAAPLCRELAATPALVAWLGGLGRAASS